MAHDSTAAPRIAVVIVSYRVRDLLRACLRSVRAQRPPVAECWVVDNASDDGSADMVADEFPEVGLVRSRENVGFARANNLAMQQAHADVFALVNPDTELPAEALAIAADVFAHESRAGVVGVALANPDGSPQPSRFAFPDIVNLAVEALGLHRLFVHAGFATVSLAPERADHTGPAPWVSGACMLVKRETFERTGGFDERLFMYGEDLDWCWRARAAGYSVMHTSRTRVLHHGGASGVAEPGKLFVSNIEGRLAFMRRTSGVFVCAVARELVTLGAVLRLVYWRVRSLAEGASPREHTRAQVERFAAVWAWRRSGAGGAGRA